MSMAAIIVLLEMSSASRPAAKQYVSGCWLTSGVLCLAASFVDGCQQAAIFTFVIQKAARWYSGRAGECVTACSRCFP